MISLHRSCEERGDYFFLIGFHAAPPRDCSLLPLAGEKTSRAPGWELGWSTRRNELAAENNAQHIEALLAVVCASWGGVPVSKVRERAATYMGRVPRAPEKRALGSKDNPTEFEALVGRAPVYEHNEDGSIKRYKSRQQQMEDSGFKMTFCNEFAGECARFAIGTYAGALDLKYFVETTHKRPYAWVDAGSSKTPKTGDILAYVKGGDRHLGVAVEVVNAILKCVEAGQGGSFFGQDYLGWTQGSWPPLNLVGWLDIDLWEYGPDYDEAQPDVDGVWTVWGDKRRYRWAYTFNAERATVTWRDVFNGKTGKGVWRYSKGKLLIDWSSGSTDIWNLPLDFNGTTGIEDMKGEGTMDLFATKP